MSLSAFTRGSVLAALMVGAAALPIKAQPAPRPEAPPAPAAPRPEAPPSNENTIGPGIHDTGSVYSEEERKKIAEAIADLYKRYRCYVLIETCEGVPEDAGVIDLKDSAAVDHALGVWKDHLVPQADKRDTVFSLVMVQSKNGHRLNYWMGYGIFSKAEGDEINHEMLHQIRSGIPNGLSYLGRVIARKQARAAKTEAELPHEREAEKTVAPQARSGDMTAFRYAAQEDGGLSGPDLDAVEAARGSVSYQALTDFAKDQIKEGRKGKDLKDDLMTFLRLLKEKRP